MYTQLGKVNAINQKVKGECQHNIKTHCIHASYMVDNHTTSVVGYVLIVFEVIGFTIYYLRCYLTEG